MKGTVANRMLNPTSAPPIATIREDALNEIPTAVAREDARWPNGVNSLRKKGILSPAPRKGVRSNPINPTVRMIVRAVAMTAFAVQTHFMERRLFSVLTATSNGVGAACELSKGMIGLDIV